MTPGDAMVIWLLFIAGWWGMRFARHIQRQIDRIGRDVDDLRGQVREALWSDDVDRDISNAVAPLTRDEVLDSVDAELERIGLRGKQEPLPPARVVRR